jgi:glycosyltransferase involved in cell wall biosynthesis
MVNVSVVVPCFNQGGLLDEAVQSVLAQTYQDFEIIIVNDGSTDGQTTSMLRSYAPPRTRVLHTDNQGLASARNNGIRQATGRYILPLDADDRIADSYLEKAVALLDANTNAGIVYSQAEYFGERTGRWDLPDYSLPGILLGNMIFASSFFRKADWEQVGGYNPNMKYGLEDYDFWLSLIELGRDVLQIPEPLFLYRQTSASMRNAITGEQLIFLSAQLFRNHLSLYEKNINVVIEHILDLKTLHFQLRERVRHLEDKVRELENRSDRGQSGQG